ncbi:MAG: DUF2238 domain-containing protein [Chitinophagaceae bacterium]|nr:DUF2238 domain-containing protein [Chitinophagaceae bacterium]
MNKMQFPNWGCWVLLIKFTLSISCLYELIECAVADVFFLEQGFAYLGTQGDIWDAQKDMFMAFCGALISMLGIYLLKRMRNK